jgi:hypothetical protein
MGSSEICLSATVGEEPVVEVALDLPLRARAVLRQLRPSGVPRSLLSLYYFPYAEFD